MSQSAMPRRRARAGDVARDAAIAADAHSGREVRGSTRPAFD